MEIKAAIIREKDKYPELGSINIDQKEGVACKVLASALNHRDLWIVKGQYAGIEYPMVLGSDGCVEYDGKKYIINPGLQWGENQNYQGNSFKILGLPDFGTFASSIVIEEQYLYPKPAHMTIEQAAALPLAGVTAFRALFTKGQLAKGEKVFISGIGGGVALFAMQFAIANGNEVYVSSSSEEKIEMARKLGANGGFYYTDNDMHKQVLKSAGPMDVIIDSAGGEGFSKLVNLTNKGARIAIYGGTAGTIALSPQRLFWNQASVFGTTMGSDKDFSDMMSFVNQHTIVPVVDSVYDIQEVERAFKRMEEGKQFGKIVLRNSF